MLLIILILLSIFFSAFFSGVEMAFLSCDRFHIELEKKKNTLKSKFFVKIFSLSKKFITSMLIGNNISLIVYSICMASIMEGFFSSFLYINNVNHFFFLFSQSFISTFIILIFSEFLPKMIFRVYAYRALNFLMFPIYYIFILLSPISDLFLWISDWFFGFLGHENVEKDTNFNKKDLIYFISENFKKCNLNKIDLKLKILHKSLYFDNIKARECMIPRKEILAMDINDVTINQIIDWFNIHGFSKLIVYSGNKDNIIGYVHYLKLFNPYINLKSIITPIEFVHETTTVKNILNTLIKKKIGATVVLDEYGGTSGLITIEDVLEKLVGNIEDEHDKKFFIEQKLLDNKFLFSARLDINYLNMKYGFNLPKSECYDTLGGFIVFLKKRIPKKGEVIVVKNLIFYLNKVSKNRIEEVIVELNK